MGARLQRRGGRGLAWRVLLDVGSCVLGKEGRFVGGDSWLSLYERCEGNVLMLCLSEGVSGWLFVKGKGAGWSCGRINDSNFKV